jgi:transglutaminase-like putative cysteine protease
MNYTIIHKTTYTYFEPVSLCHNIARLVPRSTDRQYCKNAVVEIFPLPEMLNGYEDFFGNKVIYFSIEKEHRELSVTVTSEIEKIASGEKVSDGAGNLSLEEVKRELLAPSPDSAEFRQYVFETAMTSWNDQIEAYAKLSFRTGRPVFEAAIELMHRIYTDFEYKPGLTTISTPLSIVMQQRKGVCQDFAHFAIACARSVGLAARYVSGYVETISPEGTEKLIGVDASHAWFSIFIPNMGWMDFDPTNNLIPADQHITIGWGRDYADIAPLKGILVSSGQHELAVSVDVKREA